jgi:hypothetical protein
MNQIKSLDTLVEDVYSLFNPSSTHVPSEENLDNITDELKDILRKRLAEQKRSTDPLRFSSLGKKDRQLWYQAHPDENSPPEEMSPKTYFKFLYGDVIELLLLFLIKEAGHEVTDQQAEVEVDGVKGHIDAIIDGVVVDVKSASPFGYKKFKDNTVLSDDPFGYVEQLAGYSNVLTPGKAAAWVAFDKVDGSICVTPLSQSVIKDYPPDVRISHLRDVISEDEPPARCYEPKPDGKSGNMQLITGCSYCAFKKRCWPDLRGFAYSNGPRYLTTVAKVPDVPEFKL